MDELLKINILQNYLTLELSTGQIFGEETKQLIETISSSFYSHYHKETNKGELFVPAIVFLFSILTNKNVNVTKIKELDDFLKKQKVLELFLEETEKHDIFPVFYSEIITTKTTFNSYDIGNHSGEIRYVVESFLLYLLKFI